MAVQKLEIRSRQPFKDEPGASPDTPYELIRGIAHFAVDPAAPANQRINDLDRAATAAGPGDATRPSGAEPDATGVGTLVHFSADFCILRPEEAPPGAANLLLAVPNRGRMGAVPFSIDTPWWDPTREGIAAGDGFLLRHHWAVAWCGWQWDVLSGPASLALHAPEALRDGQSIPGQVRVDFTSDLPIGDHALGDSGPMFSFRSYPAADVHQPDAVLTVRDTVDGDRRVIPRHRWRFARLDAGVAAGGPSEDDERIWLEGGFLPHRFYEVTYRTRRSPVVGTGLLAVRDFVSYLRHPGPALDEGGDPLAMAVDHAFAYGASQSGRFLRHFLYEGLNLDEGGHVVFDGVLPHIAGGRLGEFNQRYGQPSHYSQAGLGSLPPFSPAGPGPEGGLFDRQLALGGMPKVVSTNSSWEYWRGDASLNHIAVIGDEPQDLGDTPDTRIYLFAGADHLGPSPVKALMPVANATSQLDSTLLLRAALVNLAAWATDGVEPPSSRVPRIDEGNAVTPGEALAAVPAIPGARRPEPVGIAQVRRADLGPDAARGIVALPPILGRPYAAFVARADSDGNDVPGIRLPELAAPVATYTGWNPRRPVPGLPDVLHDFAGSVFPFARTAEERAANGDPRPSIAERYPDRETYAEAARAAVAELVSARLLLGEDAAIAVARAVGRYDEVAGTEARTGVASGGGLIPPT